MKPEADKIKTIGKNGGTPPRLIRFEPLRRQRSSRDLVFVKLAFWAVLAAILVLVVVAIWGLATGKPSPYPGDTGISD
jgi:hypothetical protein